MPRFTPIKVNYVALYFKDWLPALYSMSTIESGIYIRLVIHIYEAGGRLEDKTSLLATISGLSELEFSTHWTRLKSKFVHEGNYISHIRCMTELRKTFKLTENGRKAGLASAKMRKMGNSQDNGKSQQAFNGRSTGVQLLNETNTKQNDNKTNTSNINPVFQKTLDSMINSDSFSKSSSNSDSSRSPQFHEGREGDKLVLYGALQDFFNIRSNADRTALDNVCKWAVNHPQCSKEFCRKVIDLANEAKNKAKKNRWGYFFDVLRRQLGYIPGKIQE